MSKPHNTHYMYTYIQTIHTHIHTYRQIHTYTNTCMYIQTRPTHPQGGGAYYTYTHTYLHTNTYIHPYMHVHTDTPPQPTGGGGGKTTCPPYIQKPVHPDPLGGGGGWGLQTWTIYIFISHLKMFRAALRTRRPRGDRRPCGPP